MSNLKQYTIEAFILLFFVAGKLDCYIGNQFRQLSLKQFTKLPDNVPFSIAGQSFIKSKNTIKGI